MAGRRQPTQLVIAKGKKHLTKEEIAERLAREVAPATDDITAPAYLTAVQKKHFDKIAGQLKKIKRMGETDVDTLARYVVAEMQYEAATKELRALLKKRPEETGDQEYDLGVLDLWYSSQDKAAKLQDRYYKQASALARDLGLTISSRCKLVVPEAAKEQPKVNKFAQFGRAAGAE